MFQEELREIIEKHFWDDDYCYSPKATAEYSEDFNNLCNQVISQILSLIAKELPKEKDCSEISDERGIYPSEHNKIYEAQVDTYNALLTEIKQRLGIKKLLDK